jgi:hypothetical protein
VISACNNRGIFGENIDLKMSGSVIEYYVKPEILSNQIPNKSIGGNVVHPENRPETLTGFTKKIKTGCGNLYVTINEDEQGAIFELFARLGKVGGCTASQSEAIGRLVYRQGS